MLAFTSFVGQALGWPVPTGWPNVPEPILLHSSPTRSYAAALRHDLVSPHHRLIRTEHTPRKPSSSYRVDSNPPTEPWGFSANHSAPSSRTRSSRSRLCHAVLHACPVPGHPPLVCTRFEHLPLRSSRPNPRSTQSRGARRRRVWQDELIMEDLLELGDEREHELGCAGCAGSGPELVDAFGVLVPDLTFSCEDEGMEQRDGRVENAGGLCERESIGGEWDGLPEWDDLHGEWEEIASLT